MSRGYDTTEYSLLRSHRNRSKDLSKRRCLGCGKGFTSTDNSHRFCMVCKHKRYQAEYTYMQNFGKEEQHDDHMR